jgi:hypothetical protein
MPYFLPFGQLWVKQQKTIQRRHPVNSVYPCCGFNHSGEKGMTEVELYEVTASHLEVVAAFMSNYATHVSIYLSLIFGYCVVAYTAGRNLTRFQVIVVSLMFLVTAELQALFMVLWVTSAQELLQELAKVNSGFDTESGDFDGRQIVGIALWQAGIVASLAFMWSVRHPKTD